MTSIGKNHKIFDADKVREESWHKALLSNNLRPFCWKFFHMSTRLCSYTTDHSLILIFHDLFVEDIIGRGLSQKIFITYFKDVYANHTLIP